MITRRITLADGDVHSLVELFGDLGTFDNVVVNAIVSNTATLFVGDQGQQAIELPNAAIGYNFGGTLMKQIYVKGTTGDTVVVAGIDNG